MRVVIVGGRLQGVEAAYLGRKAGWEVIVVDREQNVPAAGLCDQFVHLDVTTDSTWLTKLGQVDLVIPALEKQTVLGVLAETARQAGVPLAFDQKSYSVSSSKLKSDGLFKQLGVPVPLYWPEADLPVVAKPSGSSGSRGVKVLRTEQELDSFLSSVPPAEQWVVQEFLSGPSYSLEVLGLNGKVVSYQITDLEMDASFDCKRVSAPLQITPQLEAQFRRLSSEIANSLKLTGVMDVEVINHQGTLKVLEIDARLPSQTPTVVFHSTDQNLLIPLKDIYLHGVLPEKIDITTKKAVIYEHIQVSRQRVETLGEHIMANAGPLALLKNFYGADEALTNFTPHRESWVATLIFTGVDREEVIRKRQATISSIQCSFAIPNYLDSENPFVGN